MNKNRLILYVVFGLFHLGLLIFTTYVDAQKEDFAFLTQLLSWISVTKYLAIFGLLLFLTDVAWAYWINKKTEEEKTSLRNELTTLKAKLFDLQEAAKKVTPPPSPKEIK